MGKVKILGLAAVVAICVAAVPWTVNVGTVPNDGTGDPARTAFQKINSNFVWVGTNLVHLESIAGGGVGAPNAITNNTVSNVVFVSKSGNDSTGTRHRFDKHFLTPAVSKTAAVAGDTIHFYAGNYDGTNLLKQGVNYGGNAGLLVLTPTGGAHPSGGAGMFDDRFSGATTNVIMLPATDFFNDQDDNTVDINLGVIVVTQANTRLVFRGNKAWHSTIMGAPTANAFLRVINASFVDFELNEFTSTVFDGAHEGPAMYFERAGYARVRIGRIKGDHDKGICLIEPSAGASSFLDFESSYIDTSAGEEAVRIVGVSLNWTNRLRLGIVIGGFTPAISIAGGRNFIDADYVASSAAYPVQITGGKNTIRIKRIGALAGGGFLQVTGGDNEFDIGGVPLGAGQHTVPGVDITGGTNVFRRGNFLITNAIGIRISGAQSTRLENVFVETVNSSPGGATNEAIQCNTNGLIVKNVTAKVSAGAFSIRATNGALNPIAIEGVLQVSAVMSNVAPNGLVLVDTNLYVYGHKTTSGNSTNQGTTRLVGSVVAQSTVEITALADQFLVGTDVNGVLEARSMSASTLVGRGSAAGTGTAEQITVGSGLSMSGTTLSATGGGAGGPSSSNNIPVLLSYSGTNVIVNASLGTVFILVLTNAAASPAAFVMSNGSHMSIYQIECYQGVAGFSTALFKNNGEGSATNHVCFGEDITGTPGGLLSLTTNAFKLDKVRLQYNAGVAGVPFTTNRWEVVGELHRYPTP